MMLGKVQGGTGAAAHMGRRQHKDWTHSGIGQYVVCVNRVLPGERYSCPDCGARRPA